MRVDIVFSPPFDPAALRGTHVVAVDVLRATTTIAVALANGAAGVIPVLTPEEAIATADRLGREGVVLCGERESVRIPGFDLDNSPASYPRESVAGKLLIFTTTNGTRALRAAADASSVRACALVNRTAVADALATESGTVTILCAGVHGAFALEDAIGAGALVDALERRAAPLEMTDAALAAATLFRAVEGQLAAAVVSAEHARNLAELGFTSDLTVCAALDDLTIVPTLRDEALRA